MDRRPQCSFSPTPLNISQNYLLKRRKKQSMEIKKRYFSRNQYPEPGHYILYQHKGIKSGITIKPYGIAEFNKTITGLGYLKVWDYPLKDIAWWAYFPGQEPK